MGADLAKFGFPCQVAVDEHLVTALSEVYVGAWLGKRWYMPTIFYHNQWHNKQGWHMPEKVCEAAHMKLFPQQSRPCWMRYP